MNPKEYLKKGKFTNAIKLGEINIMPVWFDSMGAKSMCTFVKTPEISVIIDPGFAIMQPSYPLKDEEKIAFLDAAEERVRKYTKKADIVIITHFHYDHHKRPNEFPESYIDKTIYIKNPNEWINYSQWKRARIMYEDMMKLFDNILKINDFKQKPKKKTYKDPYLELKLSQQRDFGNYANRHQELLKKRKSNMLNNMNAWVKKKWLTELNVGRTSIKFIKEEKIAFGATSICFPGTLFHGIEYTKTGWVEPVIVKRGKDKILFSSDIMGPNIEDYAQWIIGEHPDVMILDGPATYLLGYMFNQTNLTRCIENISRIVQEVDFEIMIYDHHLLREKKFRERMGDFYSMVEKTGKKVMTAAEWLGMPPLVDLL